MSKRFIVEWQTSDITGVKQWSEEYDSIEEIKDYCEPIWNVQRFQVHIEKDGNVSLSNKLGETFAVVGKISYSDEKV